MEPYVMDTQFQSSHQSSNSGLSRFRSAPSTLLSSLHHGGGSEKGFGQLPHPSPGKPIPRFLSTRGAPDLPPPPSPGFEAVESKPPPDGYSGFGPNRLLMGYPKPGVGPEEGPFSSRSTQQGKGVGVGGANLARQSSSPAGFFTHLINDPNSNDHMIMRGGVRNFRLGTASSGEASSSPPCSIGLKAHMDYSTGLSSPSLGHLPRIPENGAETITTKSSSDGGDGRRNRYRNGEDDARWGFPNAAWNHHQQQSDTDQMYPVSEASASQSGGEVSNRAPMLSHHLSFPRTSAEMAVAEKLLNFQDIVPCKIRAKRGFATHPRSIAERVRRTRISERMKKLQELVPNLDKQMNTAEMLELAVDYIKDLQNQYKMLCDCRARCRCLNAQYAGPN